MGPEILAALIAHHTPSVKSCNDSGLTWENGYHKCPLPNELNQISPRNKINVGYVAPLRTQYQFIKFSLSSRPVLNSLRITVVLYGYSWHVSSVVCYWLGWNLLYRWIRKICAIWRTTCCNTCIQGTLTNTSSQHLHVTDIQWGRQWADLSCINTHCWRQAVSHRRSVRDFKNDLLRGGRTAPELYLLGFCVQIEVLVTSNIYFCTS